MAYSLAVSLKPILRHAAQQLTLLGRVDDQHDFSAKWLGSPEAYDRLSSLDLLELASVVEHLELGLAISQMLLQDDWQQAHEQRDRWQANVRLSVVRSLLRSLRKWKRSSGWQQVRFE